MTSKVETSDFRHHYWCHVHDTFVLNQQNMKQPTQVFKINTVLLYHFKLRITKKTEGMLLMYNLFVKIENLPHRFTANFLLMEFIASLSFHHCLKFDTVDTPYIYRLQIYI